jgi:hypothetical protein
MSNAGNPDHWREPFPESEIPFILAAVLRCMEGERKRSPLEKENSISIRLWKRLRLDPELRRRPIQPDPEAWEIDETHPDGIIGRLDIRFTYSTGSVHPWPVFALEAKRLHVKFLSGWKSLISEYVTSNSATKVEEEQGMMCFITGRYCHGLLAGAMLGYVFDEKVTDARNAIAASIQQHAVKLRLSPGGNLQVSRIVEGETRLSESWHDLPQEMQTSPRNGKFVLYHILAAV